MLMRRLGAGLMLSAAVLAAGCTHSMCNRAPTPTVVGAAPVVPAPPAPCASCGTGAPGAVPGAVPSTAYSAPVTVTPAPSNGGLFHR